MCIYFPFLKKEVCVWRAGIFFLFVSVLSVECVVTQFSLGVETFYFTENNACFTLMGDVTLCKAADSAPPLRRGTSIILNREAKIIGIIFTLLAYVGK